MSTNFIATTPKSEIHSLAHQGILVCESFHQIRELVRSRLGDEYALLFAEPSQHQDGSAVDWYSPVQGPVRKLGELPLEEQEKMRAETIRMAKDIQRIAEDMKKSGINAQTTRGAILELALQYPDDNCIYAIGGQPVFTCWGFGPGTAGARPQDLARLSPVSAKPAANPPPPPSPEAAPKAASPPPPPPIEEPRRGFPWLLWLLPLLLLLVLFVLLTASFGGSKPIVPGLDLNLPALPFINNVPPQSGELEKLEREEEKLKAELAVAQGKLRDLAEQCPAVQPAPIAQAPAEPPRESLVIPQQSADLAFLRGRWLCDRGLVNKADKQPIVVLYEFDAKGQGTVTVRQTGREDCAGPASAAMGSDGVLRIEAGKQVCSNGRSYAEEKIECRSDDSGRAVCTGKSAAGKDWGGSVPFYRMD